MTNAVANPMTFAMCDLFAVFFGLTGVKFEEPISIL